MHILELDSFKLSDAVKFHNRLNPKIWGKDEQLLPEVREKLLAIADDFREFLGITDLDVTDITVSGSNAAYSYTPNSDIDLHLVVKFPEQNEVYQELFNAKKYQYNEEHNLAIGGIPVELYVQNADEAPVSQGEYSVSNNEWIQVPRRKRARIDDTCVRAKVEDLDSRIHSAIASNDVERMDKLWGKIKAMRQSGLDQHGEFGCENIAFKILRANGCIKELRNARNAIRDRELSLAEQNKEKKPFVYGYKSVAEDATLSPDGVSPETKMFLSEKDTPTHEEIIKDFLNYVVEELSINDVPKLRLKKDPAWSIRNKSFGRYDNNTGELIVATGNRHIMDVLRTLAHELTHRKQDEREEMPSGAGETGSSYENEANALAGILMRNYAAMHPEYFEDVAVTESASGYIPTKKQAKDPRYAMALTVDIKPGQVGKEANKMALKTNSQGKPKLLIKSANLLKEYEEFKAGIITEDDDLFEIKMTGKNLAKLAKDIEGAKVGLEFEMIVPDASVEDDGDMEPDYDEDRRVRDIDDAVDFFDDGDYNGRGDLRRLRDAMQEAFWIWRSEKLDEDWWNNGRDYFEEYLDREEPFDEDEAQEEATNELQTQYGDDITPEEFQTMLDALVEEKREAYVQEQWDDHGHNFDSAREEYEEDHREDYDEGDWLRSEGITYASDVESNFGHVTWPYYTSNSGDSEADIERIALEFMNDSGLPYDSVAVSSSYHGRYKKWVGNGWVDVGSNKPEDCFSIEPDGSLQGDDDNDVGLEFVSPPIPLDQVGDVMSKVQQWAAANGVYTGKSNKTSMHTNISVPGYDLDKLDYLKAALLLGDEYVLREFDRIGNSYAAPAIEKIKSLVNQKPEKAQELLDKMKSQLNAAASKLIHSGQTDKFTSINTKGNRVEFRSPGGDYLSDIADNPKKMQDMVNRMVVVLDAAMDPNKYKEEYQKKLYKVLTSQQFGREAKSGAKQEAKKDTNDLLNIFSRYAAGELPKAALKSFVRQAQTQRKLEKGDMGGEKFWWNVKYNDQRMEVVASNKKEAKEVAAKEWGLTPAQADTITSTAITVLRPYDDSPVKAHVGEPQPVGRQSASPTLNGRPSNPDGDWVITDAQTPSQPVYRFMASDNSDAYNVLQQWIAANPGREWRFARDMNQRLGQPGGQSAQQDQGNWGIWIDGNNRFANQPGQYARGETPPLYRFPSREAAEQWIEQQRAERPNLRTDIEVREIAPRLLPGSTLDLQRQRAAAASQGVDTNVDYEIYNRESGNAIRTFQARNDDEAMRALDDHRALMPASAADRVGVRRGPSVTNTARQPVSDINLFPEIGSAQQTPDQQQGGLVDVAGEQPAAQTGGQFTGEWKVVDPNGREIYRFSGVGNSQSDANNVAIRWLQQNPRHMQGGVEVLPVMG